MKILILKRDKIGDMLLTTPMLAWLRQQRPQAKIHVLANDYNAWVLTGNPDVDRLWVYRRVKHGGQVSLAAAWEQAVQFFALRRERFDWVIVGNGSESHRAIKRGLWVGGRRTVAYCGAGKAYAGLSDALPERVNEHEARRLAGLLTPLGLDLPAQLPYPRYALTGEAQAFAEGWLRERGLAPGGYVVLGLGARRAKKQPDTGQILRWARTLDARHGLKTVFMWTPGKSDNPLYPGDDDTAEPVLAAGEPAIHPFRGPLQPALGLIWNARSSIFPDSGLMHFAAASPGGVLGFFAETDVSPPPSQWAPLGPRARWLEARKAVSELADETVLAAVDALVGAT